MCGRGCVVLVAVDGRECSGRGRGVCGEWIRTVKEGKRCESTRYEEKVRLKLKKLKESATEHAVCNCHMRIRTPLGEGTEEVEPSAFSLQETHKQPIAAGKQKKIEGKGGDQNTLQRGDALGGDGTILQVSSHQRRRAAQKKGRAEGKPGKKEGRQGCTCRNGNPTSALQELQQRAA